MARAVSFQTRARTIDHLGRGQIADAPTAVSELWKNAYDAYARNVSLHVFAGSPEVAAIFDDGVGMDQADVLTRWLVLGTESKVEDASTLDVNSLGLPMRERQGEKGIGRLSTAFLAPVTVLLSKKDSGRFVAVLVDWRLFENPFLSLEDVKLPVDEFASTSEIVAALPEMATIVRSNLGDDGSHERALRLRAAWSRYTSYESSLDLSSTEHVIRETWTNPPILEKHLEEWPVYVGLGYHGTAMFMVGINHELRTLIRVDENSDETQQVKQDIRETLTGFTDPFAEPRPEFDYEVWLQHAKGRNEKLISADAVFGAADLHGLEHYIEGTFDQTGKFSGKVVAFGKDLGAQHFVPRQLLPQGTRDKLGSFKFCIGTFEQEHRRSTHDEQQHAALIQKALAFGGVNVYRDNLRVMPYGRENADFLGIEARRGRHAGRYFWAHRRSFGRIAFTRAANPNLRDKAGREGLVDNRARRDLVRIVSDLLIEFAGRFFGTGSTYRQDLMPGILARNAVAKAAAEKARSSRRKTIRQFLKEQAGPLEDALLRLDALGKGARHVRNTESRVEATVLESQVREMLSKRDTFRPPAIRSSLGDLEEMYRAYRDNYNLFIDRLEGVGRLSAEISAAIGTVAPEEALRRSLATQAETLDQRLSTYTRSVEEKLSVLSVKWKETFQSDRAEYVRRFGHFTEDHVDPQALVPLLNLLDAGRIEVEEEFAGRYLPFQRALQQLIDGIDLDTAYSATEDDRALLEERLRNLQTVAQVGVTVEIIGHELESLEGEVRRNLARLAVDVRSTPAFKAAMNAHLALADRLRFLSPMKVGGYRARETITGDQIANYTAEFFERTFREQRIEFVATAAFRAIRVTDIPARIFPVFLNLVNNAVYWVSQRLDRQIRLDFIAGEVIVADSGPGVDRDDVERLFDLFFTRRRLGRGVGLYLSRANLAVGNHKIRYSMPDDQKVLSGANFIIEFCGITADE